ncbi:hypothetical protein PL9214290240 [Planktothrix tepida PCC 9214]|uniref:Uncharacterized protein n=1 Tax=Planktothrix tepida PCC 9214 TaxID=671072 RepID=A0A1J1LF80_9CYAN|nr:hypothetical protein PL9214290240 [Planktothrix tepida PCC 9214]
MKNSVYFCIINELQTSSTLEKSKDFEENKPREDLDCSVDENDKITLLCLSKE